MRNPDPDILASWPPPNYINPETQGHSFLVVGITMIIICTIVVAMRIYVRWKILHNMGTDDWLVVVSLLPAIGLTTASLMGTRYGWGLHIWDNYPDWTRKSVLISWISQLLFVMSATCSKLSICWSYRRLSDSKALANILLISKIFIIIWAITFTCTTLFKCWPIHIYWTDLDEREHLCINENGPLMTASITNILTDFWLTLLPIPILWRLRLPFRQRLILTILMSLGLFACAAGIARVYYLDQTLFRTYDVTWEGYNIWLWTAVEIDLSIICCSVPPLRPLIRRHFPRILETHESFGISTITDRENPTRGAPFAPPSSSPKIRKTISTSNPNAKTHFMLANDSTEFFDRKLPIHDDHEKQLAEIARIESSPQPYTPPPLPHANRGSKTSFTYPRGSHQRANSNASTLNPPPSPYTRPLYSPPLMEATHSPHRPTFRDSYDSYAAPTEYQPSPRSPIGVAVSSPFEEAPIRPVHARMMSGGENRGGVPLRREMSSDSSNVSTYWVESGRQVSLEGPLGEAGRGGYWARGMGAGGGGSGQGVVREGVYIPPTPRSPGNRGSG